MVRCHVWHRAHDILMREYLFLSRIADSRKVAARFPNVLYDSCGDMLTLLPSRTAQLKRYTHLKRIKVLTTYASQIQGPGSVLQGRSLLKCRLRDPMLRLRL